MGKKRPTAEVSRQHTLWAGQALRDGEQRVRMDSARLIEQMAEEIDLKERHLEEMQELERAATLVKEIIDGAGSEASDKVMRTWEQRLQAIADRWYALRSIIEKEYGGHTGL